MMDSSYDGIPRRMTLFTTTNFRTASGESCKLVWPIWDMKIMITIKGPQTLTESPNNAKGCQNRSTLVPLLKVATMDSSSIFTEALVVGIACLSIIMGLYNNCNIKVLHIGKNYSGWQSIHPMIKQAMLA